MASYPKYQRSYSESELMSSITSVDRPFYKRKNSYHVAPNMFCRQSSIVANNPELPVIPDNQSVSSNQTRKLINNKKELLILISMAMIFFISLCAFSMIAPFFTLEVSDIFLFHCVFSVIVPFFMSLEVLIIFFISMFFLCLLYSSC